MQHKRNSHQGFTLLELLTVVAIIGILGALAVVGYQEYTARARAADMLVKYDAIKTTLQVRAVSLGKIDDCAELAKNFDASRLADPHATLAYGFEASGGGGGYRPVFTVCAKADAHNAIGIKVAKGAHDTMAKTGVVEKGAVLTDTLVSFALPLTTGSAPMCRTYTSQTATACANSAVATASPTSLPSVPSGQPTAGTVTQPSAQSAQSAQPAGTGSPQCGTGQEQITVTKGNNSQQVCAAICPTGQRRSPGNPTNCVPDNTGNVAGSAQAVLPVNPSASPQVRAQAQNAERQLTQSIAQATTVEEALAKTIAAAQSLPPEVLTQSVPANTPQAQEVLKRCPVKIEGACTDNYRGDCSKDFAGKLTQCVPAVVCTKSAGLCQGVTPEMRRLLDESFRRLGTR